MTYNRICTAFFVAGFIGGVYFQPGPLPHQSALAYILAEPPFLSMETLCAAVMSFSLVALIFRNLGGDQ